MINTKIAEQSARHWSSDIALIVIVAIILRLLLFNGMFGSDDGTYYRSALAVASGDFSSANYNGALRYGFNLPAGIAMYLFGSGVHAANLWPLLCSIVEVAVVYWVGRQMHGRSAGCLAALSLAVCPLHIAVATRIHADPVVSMALTTSFALLYAGLRQENRRLLFLAGLSLGFVFWSKELAAVCYFAVVPLIYLSRRRCADMIVVAAGLVLMLAGHGLLMYVIAGDPLHLIKVVLGALGRNFIEGGDGRDEAWYYLPYLFVDLRHVGLLGWLGFASLAMLWRPRGAPSKPDHFSRLFLTLWFAGLLLVLSCFPVSLSPLRFAMKQSNYLTLFLAPMAILGGIFLASMSPVVGRVGVALTTALGIALAAFQQADYRVFTANSKAVAEFAAEHPDSVILVSTNNDSLGSVLLHMRGLKANLISWKDAKSSAEKYHRMVSEARVLYAVYDYQTANWSTGSSPLKVPPSCWVSRGKLEPRGFGVGNQVAGVVAASIRPVSENIAAKFQALAVPAPAILYAVAAKDPWCASQQR